MSIPKIRKTCSHPKHISFIGSDTLFLVAWLSSRFSFLVTVHLLFTITILCCRRGILIFRYGWRIPILFDIRRTQVATSRVDLLFKGDRFFWWAKSPGSSLASRLSELVVPTWVRSSWIMRINWNPWSQYVSNLCWLIGIFWVQFSEFSRV